MRVTTLARHSLTVLLRKVPKTRWYSVLSLVLAEAPNDVKLQQGVLTMWGSLENLRRAGFEPRTILDIGAWIGAWTERAHAIFPSATVVMVEANPQKASILESVSTRLGDRIRYRRALLGSQPKAAVDFYAMESGSSVLEEKTLFPRTRLSLPMETLDNVAAEFAPIEGPLLIKIDVQGFELEVLRGGSHTLQLAEVVILEVSFLEYNVGAPLAAEVFAFMKAAGFVAYDLCGMFRRESDGAIIQADFMFVRDGSALRAPKKFWASEPDQGLASTAAGSAR